jgi:hypothetical protein
MKEIKNFEVDFQKVVRAYSTLYDVFVSERKYDIDLVDIRNVDKIVLPRIYGHAYYDWRNNPLRGKVGDVITVDDFNKFEVIDTGGKGRVRISFITHDVFSIRTYIINENEIRPVFLWENDDEAGRISNSLLSRKGVKDACKDYWNVVNKLPYDLSDHRRRLLEDHLTLDAIKELSDVGATVMTILYLMFNFSDKFSIATEDDKDLVLKYINAVREMITGFGEDIPSAIESMALFDIFIG